MRLGIDIGGTYLRYEIRDAAQTIEKGTLRSAQTELCVFIQETLERKRSITSVFISFAGQVQDGKIIDSPHLKTKIKDIKNYIQSRYAVELLIENDLTCAVLAEARFYRSENITALYVGTGLGMGVISEGRVVHGAANIAAEIGHIPYKEAPFSCSCGKTNCLELYASGSGIARFLEYNELDRDLQLQQLRKSQKSSAKEIYANFIEALLHAAGSAITLCNPEILVLGGGIMHDDLQIYDTIVKKIGHYAMPLSLQNAKIVLSQLEDAALEGAFLLKDTYVK